MNNSVTKVLKQSDYIKIKINKRKYQVLVPFSRVPLQL